MFICNCIDNNSAMNYTVIVQYDGGIMTVEEAAAKLGKTPRQIYYAIATNKIKPQKRGDVYWINSAQLEKLKALK